MQVEDFQQMLLQMLQRRGYDHVQLTQTNGGIECHIEHGEESITLLFRQQDVAYMTYDKLRDLIDDRLADGMKHVVHECGQVLLETPVGWMGMGPYKDLELGYYLVPLQWGSKLLYRCPTCGKKVDIEGDDETEYKEGDILLPRVDDPGLM